MSERIAPTYVRVEFTAAIKRAAWTRCGGRCENCGKVLQHHKYRYDHRIPARRGGTSTIDNCWVLCNDGPSSCDYRKTNAEDLPGIRAIKTYGKNRLPLDIDRPERESSKIPQRPTNWPKRAFPNRKRQAR